MEVLPCEPTIFPDSPTEICIEVCTSSPLVFADLPNEIQLKVFSYLSKSDMAAAAQVCRSWREKIYDPSLWKEITFPDLTKNIDSAMAVLNRTTMLRSLTMRNVICDTVFKKLPALPSLRSLDLAQFHNLRSVYRESPFDSFNRTVLQKCPFIESLNLQSNANVTDETILAISELKYLKNLNLAHCERISSEAIVSLVKKCSLLEVLNLDGIPKLKDSAICAVGVHLNKTLTSLLIDGEGITDKSLKELQKCVHLNSLSISYADSITDEGFLCIKSFSHLKSLKILQGKDVSSSAISNLFNGPHLKNLESIEFESLSIDDNGVENLVKCCINLKVLSLPCCWQITDVGLEAIINGCKYLEHLELVGLFRLTGVCLSEVPHKLPHLKLLNLEQCERIVDIVLEDLHRDMPALKIIRYFGEALFPAYSFSDNSDDDAWVSEDDLEDIDDGMYYDDDDDWLGFDDVVVNDDNENLGHELDNEDLFLDADIYINDEDIVPEVIVPEQEDDDDLLYCHPFEQDDDLLYYHPFEQEVESSEDFLTYNDDLI